MPDSIEPNATSRHRPPSPDKDQVRLIEGFSGASSGLVFGGKGIGLYESNP